MKTIKDYNGQEVAVFETSDLASVAPHIEEAKKVWEARCDQYMRQHGDSGTCVLGAGIAIRFRPPRCRSYRLKTIISASEVCNAQGSLVWEDSRKEVQDLLKSKGIDTIYEWGNMD